jgi:hypothetical protein
MPPRGAYAIKQRGRCSVCGQSVALTKQGYVYRHGSTGVFPPADCEGTGRKPAPAGQRDGA